MKWTEAQVDELFRLRAMGLSFADIGLAFDCPAWRARDKWVRQCAVKRNRVNATALHAANHERIMAERALMAARRRVGRLK